MLDRHLYLERDSNRCSQTVSVIERAITEIHKCVFIYTNN